MGKFFKTVVLKSQVMASPLRLEWVNLQTFWQSLWILQRTSELRESLMKVVAQVWADPFMKERVKVSFFSSMLYTPLLTIRYTCTEYNQTIALVGVPSKLLGWPRWGSMGLLVGKIADTDNMAGDWGGDWSEGVELVLEGERLTKVMCDLFDLFFIFLGVYWEVFLFTFIREWIIWGQWFRKSGGILGC